MVEGRSAAQAVNCVRNRQQQAVLALQGKIPNSATTAGLRRALRNEQVSKLLSLLNVNRGQCRFSRMLLLCDADVDGLHARSLLVTLLRVHLTSLLEHQLVFHVYPPLLELIDVNSGERRFSWHQDAASVVHASNSVGSSSFQLTRYKGIASMNAEALATTCIHPSTRNQQLVTPRDKRPVC